MGSLPTDGQFPALKTNPNFVFFTDFDGTITLKDSNDWMTENLGYGVERRKKVNEDILQGHISFRDGFRDMMDSVKTPWSKCVEHLVANIKLDPGFKDFYLWARENNIPVVVVSSGMTPVIRALLRHLIGPEGDEIQVVCNESRARPGKSVEDEGGWEIIYHDDSSFGHDKSLTLRPYAQLPKEKRPWMFYAGDGVSDLSAARESDLLFAKKGHDLVRFCVKEDVPFTLFESFKDIHAKVKEIHAGQKTMEQSAKEGVEAFQKGEAGVKA